MQQVPKTETLTCNLRTIFLVIKGIAQKFSSGDYKFIVQWLKSTTATKLAQLSKILLILWGKALEVIKENQVILLWGNNGLDCYK